MAHKRSKDREYRDKRRQEKAREAAPSAPQQLTETQAVPQQGLRLPDPPGQGQRYLMQANDGTLVWVSAERLNEWLQAQSSAEQEQLNKGEERLLDRALQLIYGKEEK